MCQRDTTVPQRSCLHGKNMTWKLTYGAQDAYSRRCLKESLYSPEKITSISSPLLQSFWVHHQMMSFRPLAAKMYNVSLRKALCIADTWTQTLRFVQSLPKRERQPLSNKFKNADPLGMIISPSKVYLLTRESNRSARENASVRSSATSKGRRRSST